MYYIQLTHFVVFGGCCWSFNIHAMASYIIQLCQSNKIVHLLFPKPSSNQYKKIKKERKGEKRKYIIRARKFTLTNFRINIVPCLCICRSLQQQGNTQQVPSLFFSFDTHNKFLHIDLVYNNKSKIRFKFKKSVSNETNRITHESTVRVVDYRRQRVIIVQKHEKLFSL